jgi:hypothetical protein
MTLIEKKCYILKKVTEGWDIYYDTRIRKYIFGCGSVTLTEKEVKVLLKIGGDKNFQKIFAKTGNRSSAIVHNTTWNKKARILFKVR